MKNGRQASLPRYVRACARSARRPALSRWIRLLTRVEDLQYEEYLRREDVDVAVLALHKACKPIAGCRRVGHSAPPSGAGQHRGADAGPVRPRSGALDDFGARHAVPHADGDGGRLRGGRPKTRSGSRDRRRLPHVDPSEAGGGLGRLAASYSSQPSGIVRARASSRPSCSPSRKVSGLLKPSALSPEQQAQAGQTTDVRQRKS